MHTLSYTNHTLHRAHRKTLVNVIMWKKNNVEIKKKIVFL